MTRAQDRQRPWTTTDLRYLCESAGTVRVPDMCCHLGRTSHAVLKQASRMGLSVRYRIRELVWCDRCATWRTSVDVDGACPVCKLKESLERARVRHEHERTYLTQSQALRLEDIAAQREEDAAKARLTREVNRTKKDTERVREVTGRNPRKGGARHKK